MIRVIFLRISGGFPVFQDKENFPMAKRKQEYGNDSISMLEGPTGCAKRPAVIFGSDGLEGCEHAVFEIMSNAIDEAREGYGREIILTRFRDGRIQVEDFGRGCPVDWNEKEQKYNWELVFCELYAGGKYDNAAGDNYEYSLGLNGLGACATQYASAFMDVTVRRDGKRYDLHFEKGQPGGGDAGGPQPTGKRRAPPSPGCLTWRSLPRSTSPRSTSPTSSTARRW